MCMCIIQEIISVTLLALYEANTNGSFKCILIVCFNISAYLHVIQKGIYTCPPYGHGLHWYVHNILLVVTIPNYMNLNA